MKSLAVIPARGGSKGVPRKSIRPVAGKPMIYYGIQACLGSDAIDRIVVSTDDDEIALLAERFGACVIMRDEALAQDVTTLDPVIESAVLAAEDRYGEEYSHVYTVQPTSPLIQSHDLDRAAELFENNVGSDSVLTVVDDRHLCWTKKEGEAVPAYEARVNRQQLPANFRETGAVIACTRNQLKTGTRIGSNVQLLEMPAIRSFDIDNFSDLYLCESILSRKKIVFAVVGYPEVGLGHAFRTVMLAHELVNYDLVFLCEEKSQLAANYIKSFNYNVEICADGDLVTALNSIKPDLVINDLLDTCLEYMQQIKTLGCKLVNFEDLGDGANYADLVINALYPHQKGDDKKLLVGANYFCLREEFLHPPKLPKPVSETLEVLITFGGVDEGDITLRIVKLLADKFSDLSIVVVTGPGYVHRESLAHHIRELDSPNINWVFNTKRISDYMFKADMAITSAGRTVLELASTETPMITICQNQRETTHTFASKENGVLNLGYREDVGDQDILDAVTSLLSEANRNAAIEKMALLDLTKGKSRVIKKIVGLVS